MTVKPTILRKRVLRLPVYFWAAVIISTLIGVTIGAVLFSATFQAHVKIIPRPQGSMTILDADGTTVLATNLLPNQHTLEYGEIFAGTIISHDIYVKNTGPPESSPFYIRTNLNESLPGSSFSTEPTSLPSGIGLEVFPEGGCGELGGTISNGVCSIEFFSGNAVAFNTALITRLEAAPQDLTFTFTIAAFDVAF